MFFVAAVDRAAAETSGDFGYQLINGGAEVEITGYHGAGGHVEIPETIDGKPVTSIGQGVFYFCTSLTSVSLPNSLKNIGNGAFQQCTFLTSLHIPSNVTTIGEAAFFFCLSMIEIDVNASNPNYASADGVLYDKPFATLIQYPGARVGAFALPSSVTSIGAGAFAGSASLTSLVIPSGVTSIKKWAFEYCTSLTSVSIPNGVTVVENFTFDHCTSLSYVAMPNSVNSIGKGAFEDCTSLTSVSIPDSVTVILDFAFYNCTSLISLNLPNSVTTVGYGAFQQCASLASVTIGSGVMSIGGYAFAYCNALISVAIPIGVTIVGQGAFSFCISLIEIHVNASNPNYASVDGVLYDKAITALIQCPGGRTGTIAVADSVTTIGYKAFAGCAFLTSVTLPSGVTTIGIVAFLSCTSLTSITFLGLVAPTTVGVNWILDTNAGILGHAYAASNFPAPDGDFHGLTMGAVIPVAPGVPTGLSATGGNTQVVLAWSAPASDGGSAITNYSVYRSTAETGTYSLIASSIGLTYTDTGLTNGVTYYYKVAAHNSYGQGPDSDRASSTPAGPPAAPVVAVSAGNQVVQLTWPAVTDTGGIPLGGYKVYMKQGSASYGAPISLSNSTLIYVWGELTNGETYSFKVSAFNALGETNSTEISATPAAPPSEPQNVAIAMDGSSVVVTWFAPSSAGGLGIEHYRVWRGNSSSGLSVIATLGPSATSFKDSNVSASTRYYYAVSADNSFANGPASASVGITTPAPPTPQSDNTMLYAAIGAVVAVALVGAALVMIRRKKQT